jgi:hypothetical protein
MERAFHEYINLHVLYGYTFAQAVTTFLEDEFYTEMEKTAPWVNEARNRILLELQQAANNARQRNPIH